MSSVLPPAATLADLARVDGKAELIGGKVVPLMPTGFHPGRIGGRIFRSLDDHARLTGHGVALPDNVGFAVPELASGRESFAPDASFFVGPLPADEMDFMEGPPTLAVEVRSKGDYGESAEEAMAGKRADYFEAGTTVVWDVDPVAGCVRVYRAAAPDRPDTFGRGQTAEAQPAVPGWQMSVDEILASP
jgi:Uma2 family endonuclease